MKKTLLKVSSYSWTSTGTTCLGSSADTQIVWAAQMQMVGCSLPLKFSCIMMPSKIRKMT